MQQSEEIQNRTIESRDLLERFEYVLKTPIHNKAEAIGKEMTCERSKAVSESEPPPFSLSKSEIREKEKPH